MKIFVAGATGVLGRRLAHKFIESGHTVLGLARSAKNETAIRACGGESRSGDLFDAESLARAADGAEIVIHAATSIPTKTKPAPEDWQMNDRIRRDGTRALADCAARIGARMLLVQSITWAARPTDGSAFDEDSPLCPDFITQSAADMETIAREAGQKHGFGVAVLRCGWFYAPEAAHTRLFGEQLSRRKLPIIGKGDSIWSWIHVDDAAGAFLAAAEAKRSGVWHIVDDQPVKAEEYLRAFADRLGAAPPRRVPIWLARLAVGSSAANFLTTSTRTSNMRLRRDFGWSPRFPTYREGLEDVVAMWRRENFLGLGAKAAA